MSIPLGTILIGTIRGKLAAKHPIAYWRPDKGSTFVGLVLTHSKGYGNLEMLESHFDYDRDSGYSFDENHPTYLVKCLFMKPGDWGPYKSIGKLTEEGIRFAEHVVRGVEPIYWEDYIRKA